MPETSLQELKPSVIKQIISRAIIEAEIREEVARFLESVTQVRLHEMLRGLDAEVDSEGWQNLRFAEKQLCKSLAEAVRAGQKVWKEDGLLDQIVKEMDAR